MKSFLTIGSFFILVLLSGVALAHSYQQGDLRIGHVWTRATPAGATTAAVYFPVLNTGTTADKLLGASSPDAAQIQIHDHIDENGITKMVSVDSVVLDPNHPVSFQPVGKHLMVIGLKHALKEGDRFPLTLQFEKAGTLDVEAVVEPLTATPSHNH